MNINDLRSAYDGVHATKSLKKKVMDGAKKKSKSISRGSRFGRRFLPVFGGIAGAAAAVTLTVLGTGYARGLFGGSPVESVKPEKPVLTDSLMYAPPRGVVGELVSPRVSPSPEAYDTMPELTLAGAGMPMQSDYTEFRSAFKPIFTSYGEELVNYVGRKEFDDWTDKFLLTAHNVSGQTFYNQATLLAYVTYFEISEKDAAELFSDYYSALFDRSFTDEEVRAIASRDEDACRRLFVNDEVPLVTKDESGYTFYTLENLYEMPSRELYGLLKKEGDLTAQTLVPLQEWADGVPDPIYSAAVRRKIIMVTSYLENDSRPRLGGDQKYYDYYWQKVCDFNEYIEINDCVIFNYVRRLVEQHTSEQYLLDSAFYGAAGEPNYYTIPSYRRLLDKEQLGITPEELCEALSMTDLHYYGQTGFHLYTDNDMQIIAYGTPEEFIGKYVYGNVLQSESNPVGSMLWLSAADLYNGSAADWLEYGDLSVDTLTEAWYLIGDVFNMGKTDQQIEWLDSFTRKLEQYKEIRCLTAAYLDGGALAADDELLGEPPEPEKNSARKLSSIASPLYDETTDSVTISEADIYGKTMTELAQMGMSGTMYFQQASYIASELGGECGRYLLRKAYLYRWHTDYINLYCDEYIRLLPDMADNTVTTDGRCAFIADTDGRGQVEELLKKWHIANIDAGGDNTGVEPADYGNATVLDDGEEEGAIIDASEDTDDDDDETVEENDDENCEEGFVVDGGDYQPPENAAPAHSDRGYTDIGEYMLDMPENPLLPNSGGRGLFCCAWFGWDKWLETEHYGMDFAVFEGAGIAALDNGTVSFSGEKGDLGLCVIIEHDGGLQSVYAHCSQLYVSEGQAVEAGNIIAAVGSTGYSAGPHLHFEVRLNDEAVDPLPYLKK